MSTRTINQNAIDSVERSIDNLSDQARNLQNVTSDIQGKANRLNGAISAVKQEFASFKAFDEKQKELIKAKTQLISIRQNIKEQFGKNDDVRQYLTGILEASDLSIVKKEIISNCTEELMISCPRYWLAPVLIALAAWLDDNKPLADRALEEALKRDDEKTSLLFALICRRIGRSNASASWLSRYFAMQDPKNIERKIISLLDAYSNGLFGEDAKRMCTDKVLQWIEELSEEPGFSESQQASWESAILSKVDNVSYASRYPYAAKWVTNWVYCEKSLNETAIHEKMYDYFLTIFEKESATHAALSVQLDELMEVYISSYDNEELPLRREERLKELIVQERGDLVHANVRFQSEQKALEESIDFTSLLTNAAMHADIVKASTATQKLAIALSKDWLIAAYNNVILRIRQGIPDSFQVSIDDFNAQISNGTEEAHLVPQATTHFEKRRDNEIEAIVQSKWDMVLPIATCVAGLIALIGGQAALGLFGLLGAGGLVLRWHLNGKKIINQKQQVSDRYSKIIQNSGDTIRTLCSERVDYIKEIENQDSQSQKTLEYLSQISPAQYVSSGSNRSLVLED